MTRRPPPPVAPQLQAAGRQSALRSRRTRAEVKVRVRSGLLSAAEVVRLAGVDDDLGRAVARMRLGELLLSIPGVGPATAERALVAAGVSGQRRLGQLGPRQVERLGGLL